MDRITRKELKTDHFVTTVGHTLEGLSQHRQEVKRYALIGVVVLVLVIATVSFFRWRAAERQEALAAFFRVMESPVNADGSLGSRAFRTEEEKDEATAKAVVDLLAKYPGSNEAAIAVYFRATDTIEKGDLNKGLEDLEIAIRDGDANTRALANFAKAGVLRAQRKEDEAEKLLRAVMAKPGSMIMVDQVALELAGLLAESKPDEALKLLEPLRTTEGTAQRNAIKMFSDISRRKEQASAN